MDIKTKDVIIIGGGLAGLTLAHQLRSGQLNLNILVVEKNSFPIPEKIAKVGESTVEIGSHYLTNTLGLGNHFDERHLRKHGLRCFFGSPQTDFSQQDELGVSQLFGLPTYQIDRGAIENQLHQRISRDGVEVIDGASISNICIDDAKLGKKVTVTTAHNEQQYQSRWLVDAAGRQALLKNKLNLHAPTEHRGNALWFRINRQIKLDSWSSSLDWQARIEQPNTRWLSTNHLMGSGYWVWIIPLDNGATSIGIVMDDQAFSSHDFSNHKSTMRWLHQHHPHCAQAIEGAEVLDYVVINDYSLNCKQMFAHQGWGITGESGLFADPFYSPGTDFIAFNNSFLNNLIQRDLNGHEIKLDSHIYHNIFKSFYDSTMSLYTGQYGGFGDRRLMSLKLVWDYSYYWGVLTLLFFKSAFSDIALMRELTPLLQAAQASNQQMQSLFRKRAVQRIVLPTQSLFMNQYPIPCLQYFNSVLDSCESLSTQISLSNNVEKLNRIAFYIEQILRDNANLNICDEEFDLFGDYRKLVLA